VGFVNIHRSIPAALGAFAAPYFLDFLFQHLGRDVNGDEVDAGVV
jgi:hypothetical protein